MRKSIPAIQLDASSYGRIYRSIRTFVLVNLTCIYAWTLPARLSAQPPPLSDPVRQLSDRLDSLEKENAATRAENARLQSFIRGRFPDFTTDTAPVAGVQNGTSDFAPSHSSTDTGSLPENIIERLGTRYNNGFVLVESPDPKRVPFYLRLNAYTQFRYLNQQLDSFEFTDHLGNVRPVDPRNDFNLNRQFIYFSGFVLDPKLVYSLTLGTRYVKLDRLHRPGRLHWLRVRQSIQTLCRLLGYAGLTNPDA